jgi:hypothetical protein
MTEEQRLQAITEMLILVRDNLFRGMSKSIQKLQARSINEVLELPNYTESPQRQWQGLTDEDYKGISSGDQVVAMWAERILKERNT